MLKSWNVRWQKGKRIKKKIEKAQCRDALIIYYKIDGEVFFAELCKRDREMYKAIVDIFLITSQTSSLRVNDFS